MTNIKRLNNDEVLLVCRNFLKGRGYACRLTLNDNIKQYLLKYGYIYSNKGLDDYYFLDDKFYKNYKKNIESLNFNKIEKKLIKNYNALSIVYFDEEIMHLFLNNPKLHFVWNGYRGYVCSKEDSKMDIYIKDLCLCHDLEENKIVLGAFLVDLIDCSEQSQLILQSYMLEHNDNKYEFHYYNYKNLILGEWLDYNELDIYTVILEGIKVVNYIFKEKYGFCLYKNEYSVNELQFFMPLFFPTKVNRFNFMMELAKIFLDNINGKSLKKLIREKYEDMSNKNEFTLEDLKKEDFREYKTFKTYFSQYNLFNKIAFSKLDDIRSLRTEPAHKIYTNDLNYLYCKEQDETLKNLYRVIYNIIKVEDPDYKLLKQYQDGVYECFYGDKGNISEHNGFNATNYHYYNGYIRLINDKFGKGDSEILIAGNNKEAMKKNLVNHMKNNCNVDTKELSNIVDYIFSEEICKPTEIELKSFFLGKSYIKQFFGECRNYKKDGINLYNEFKKNNYKYIFVFTDSTDPYWDIPKSIKYIKDDKNVLFRCGLLMLLLSNNFAEDNTNIFLNDNKDLLILNNIWD